MTQSIPRFRSLSPAYVSGQHKDYVEILTAELTKKGPSAPRNIALTGHYGSGKSSVLSETQRKLEGGGVTVVNLSLPSLGIGDGRMREDGDKALDKTNLIQKEIVKQLLYRRKPSKMPASRYSRLDTFRLGRAIRFAAGIGIAVTGFALIAKLPDKFREALPPEVWTWGDEQLWNGFSVLIQWLSLLGVFALTVSTALWVQRLLQQRLRVTELAAGPTKVTLSSSSSSYFDEYLDEIVYFFQVSVAAVVIFEDLDRFKDPHIFETLRELNLLLNNAEQTGTEPIRFVYAIRDSIFEQLDVDVDGEGVSSTDHGETRRLTSTNRTKFFDLVVPMVPFISHRTSRDLIRQELKTIALESRPGNIVVGIVGAHLTDMRLIKNICNEYEMFQRRILTDGGLKELTADRLFSSIVYKNLYLADYEKIRDGTSLLDSLYRAYREWVGQQTAAARSAERGGREKLRRIDAVGAHATSLGTRLQHVLLARCGVAPSTNTPEVHAAGADHGWDSLPEPAFWQTYLKERGDMLVDYQPGSSPVAISFENVEALMGIPLVPEEWKADAKLEVAKEISEAANDQRIVQQASMTDALAETDKHFSYEGEERSIAGVAAELFDGADLALELLRAGLIDENFTLYITQFPGQAISASAMNFIIKAVQPDVMDMEYHFGAGDKVENDDIKAVLDAEAPRLLGGQSVYNIEIFDYLFGEDSEKLDEPISRLAANASSYRDFIDAYVTSGKAAHSLIQRMSGAWPGVFDYLIGHDPEPHRQDLLDAAFNGVRAEVTYTVDERQRGALAIAIPSLAIVKEPQKAERAAAIAETILRLGIQVDDLNTVADPLRAELCKRSIYPITLANLAAVLGEGESLSLDSIKAVREPDVYAHVIAHLPDYIEALGQANEIPTIAEPDRFAEVLSDVAAAQIDLLEDVARGARGDCMLSDLDELEPPFWPAVAGAHRLTLTARNVATYVDYHEVDSDLANWLRSAGAIVVNEDDPTPLGQLALNLLNAAALRDGVALQLIEGLGLEPESIAAASLHKDAHNLLPALIRKGVVSDDADAYAILEADDWTNKKELIRASEAFPTYMAELPLDTQDLFWIASDAVPDAVKDVLLNELGTFGARIGPKGATALAEWCSANGRTPAASSIVIMAKKGGAGSAGPILKLLGAQAATIDLELLKSALNALNVPYSQLTTPGRERPKIRNFDGVAAVLTRLQKASIVSKFKEDANKQIFKISKRHS